MNFCLSKQSLEALLKFLYDNKKHPIEDEILLSIYDGACGWNFEVSLIIYFFTSYIQRRSNNGLFDFEEIEIFYNLSNMGNFRYQQFDREFIDYLFSYSRSKMNMSLEEILVEVQQDLSDYNYESNFRY